MFQYDKSHVVNNQNDWQVEEAKEGFALSQLEEEFGGPATATGCDDGKSIG